MSTRELSVRIGGKKIKTKPLKVKVHGVNIIHDALYNKGMGFPDGERDRLGKSINTILSNFF
jgi:hypothetical protein